MTTVFFSGSRRLSRLNSMIRSRVDNILRQRFRVVIGDANGADNALQSYLAQQGYGNVIVYCSGGRCRNNVGSWPTRQIAVGPGVKGREFYMAKDKAMARDSDCGLVLWDGASVGAFGNIIELAKRGRKAVVYLSPERCFHQISNVEQVHTLLKSRPDETVREICKRLNLDATALSRPEPLPQSTLLFDP